MYKYTGDFEIHITIQTNTNSQLQHFQDWCRQRQFKCVRIILDRGQHMEQPMATWRRGATTSPIVVTEAHNYADALNREAITVVRVKVEAAPGNEGVPKTDTDAVHHDAHNYFEHHIKLCRVVSAGRTMLESVCEQHNAHLSRNAFRQPTYGVEERFVTLRTYRAGRDTSMAQLRHLLEALSTLNETIIEHESEYCVYDSNLDLDAGWLPSDHDKSNNR